jgi:hypothetical protein
LALDVAKQHCDEAHLGDARFFARREEAITTLSGMSCEEAVLTFPRDDEASSLSALVVTGILRATMSCENCGEGMTMRVGVKASVMEWRCRNMHRAAVYKDSCFTGSHIGAPVLLRCSLQFWPDSPQCRVASELHISAQAVQSAYERMRSVFTRAMEGISLGGDGKIVEVSYFLRVLLGR